MRKISVSQFRRLCEERMFSNYTYDTREQEWDTVFEPVRVKSGYNIMHTFLAPASICFQNRHGSLCFDRVKYILAGCDETSDHMHFSIVCGNHTDSDNDISYQMDAWEKS